METIFKTKREYIETVDVNKTVSWFRRVVAAFSLQRREFDPRPVHVGFMVDDVVTGQVFL